MYVFIQYYLREFACHTTVILAQLRGKWGPSGSRLRRSVGCVGRVPRSMVFFCYSWGADPPKIAQIAPLFRPKYAKKVRKNDLYM